jgi:hypothetical protein
MDIEQVTNPAVAGKYSPEVLAKTSRRAKLLQAAAEVSRTASSMLDPNLLLPRIVDIICEAYGFYYAGIFLIETLADDKQWAVLKARLVSTTRAPFASRSRPTSIRILIL